MVFLRRGHALGRRGHIVIGHNLSDPGAVSVSLSNLTTGEAREGDAIGYTVSEGTPTAQRWQQSSDGTNWTDVAGATTATETVDIGGDHTDKNFLRVGVTVDGTEYFSNAAQMRHAPGAFAALVNQSFTEGTGNQTYVFAAATGTGLTWTYTLVDPPAGVTIDSATRTVTFDTDALAVQSGTEITVRASDQYPRAIDRTFTLEITAAGASITALTLDDPQQSDGDIGLNYTLSQAGDQSVEFMIIPSAATAPDDTQFTAGTDGDDNAAVETFTDTWNNASGSSNVTITTANLNSAHKIAARIVGTTGGIIVSNAIHFDTTPPVSSITGVTAGDTQLTIDWTAGQGVGEARIVVVADGEDPSSEEVFAGQTQGGGAPAGDSGLITVTTSGAQTAVVITGLPNGTTHDVHLVHDDEHDNLMAAPNESQDAVPTGGGGSAVTFVGWNEDTPEAEQTSSSATRTFSGVTLGTGQILVVYQAVAVDGSRHPTIVSVDGTNATALFEVNSTTIMGPIGFWLRTGNTAATGDVALQFGTDLLDVSAGRLLIDAGATVNVGTPVEAQASPAVTSGIAVQAGDIIIAAASCQNCDDIGITSDQAWAVVTEHLSDPAPNMRSDERPQLATIECSQTGTVVLTATAVNSSENPKIAAILVRPA